ncbi:FhaA domain-containing protein [Mycobacterium lepromatosis]|uniref:FHA domain-containing protein n=1 Tax=Mycobacterium lepromatosis TaxID=480418 RepID=A0A0F4ETL6_9MYCO|nr:FhaA domain-containing protein [Mycobacterium lepromatosis]KJX75937.1 hypothetical protein MLPM_0022 [Mycobacterium lepromatosis]UKN41429.1 FHA domain-containing protein FhaA [Mycobacterium lepromatosis]
MDNQKEFVQRIERKLESSIGDAFARMFGGSIVPQEVEALLRREAADGIRSLQGNRILAPNEYIITLGVHDLEKMEADPDRTSSAFARDLADYIHEQGWQTYGDVVVRFDQSSSLHTGQIRARSAVNPDVESRPTVNDPVRTQSSQAFSAEPGVPPMTDNWSYRGVQGQGRPSDDYYCDDRYGQPQDDPRGADPQGGQDDPRGCYSPKPGNYPQQPGHPPLRRPDQGGYPGQSGYEDQRAYYDQGQGGYPPPYGQRPANPGGYGSQGHDQGYRPGSYNPSSGGQPGYGGYRDYGRGPAHPDEGSYTPSSLPTPPEQRVAYPDQGSGYDQGYQHGVLGYGRKDYGQQDYTQYAENPPGGMYAPSSGEYAEPADRDYEYNQPGGANDYGQRVSGGYGGYGQVGYGAPGSAVILQLDDGSGRTYQLCEGSNIVGRGQDAQFRLPDTGVSRRHLEIRWDGQVALLSDLNSTNGTTVNNAPVQEWQLADGDVIRLGHSEIIVRIH